MLFGLGTDNVKKYMILWYQKVVISWNWHIRSRPGHWTTAGKGTLKLWIWWSTRCYNTPAHCFCRQESIWCGVVVQQYRERNTWNSVWVGEIPLPLVCKWSTCHHRPQTIDSYNGYRCGNTITMPTMHNFVHTPIQLCVLYKPDPKLFTSDCLLCHDPKENKDREMWSQSINVNTINTTVDLPACTSMQDIQEATAKDAHLQELKAYVIQGWSHKKEDMAQDIQKG